MDLRERRSSSLLLYNGRTASLSTTSRIVSIGSMPNSTLSALATWMGEMWRPFCTPAPSWSIHLQSRFSRYVKTCSFRVEFESRPSIFQCCRLLLLNRVYNIENWMIFCCFVFQDHVYWTDWTKEAIMKTNKFQSTGAESVVTGVDNPMDIQVYHRARQPLGRNIYKHEWINPYSNRHESTEKEQLEWFLECMHRYLLLLSVLMVR